MKINFVKYQGTGNDFIMIDDRKHQFPDDTTIISSLCNRRKGIGADGLILIREHDELDFQMIYYNADGSQSMCGNGSRCAVNYANSLGMIEGKKTHFLSTDGPHIAFLTDQENVELQLTDVSEVLSYNEEEVFIDTGSPHHIRFVDDVKNYDVYQNGKTIREDSEKYPNGTNVNFVEVTGPQSIYVRTFERGVEDETLSCGTGVTAASLAAHLRNIASPVNIETLGGSLKVKFDRGKNDNFKNVFLIGPAEKVFDGQIEI
ncbi:MAG: diaminopimelate epimerase [Bacteroidota bacterium]